MTETSVEWSDLHLFLAVAREGGLSPASRLTGKSAATLGRRMNALERSLGRDLLIRHDRGYDLTPDGRKFLQQLSEIEARIDRLTTSPTGTALPLVKLSAGSWTTLLLLDRVDELIGDPPDLRLRFVSAEAVLDIPHRDVVIGFRNHRPTVQTLAARKLGRIEFAPYATDAAARHWIRVLADTPSARWLHENRAKDALYEVNTPRNSLDLAIRGKGIAVLPTFIGDSRLELIRVGDCIDELAHDQWIVSHQDDRHLPEVRRVIDRLYTVLENEDQKYRARS